MKKAGNILSFGILSFVLGALAGAAVWAILRILSSGICLIWEVIPGEIGFESSLIYNLAACLAGGLIIGLWQKKHGLLPEDTQQVTAQIKQKGFYPYDRLHILTVSALLPLIFGGALGPEAGLVGVIAGLCCFVGDKLKYKADQVAQLSEVGMAAALSIVFGAPFFGIVDSLEPEKWDRSGRRELVGKKTRIFIYILGVLGGILVMAGMSSLFGGGSGLPRFEAQHQIGLQQWKWFPMLAAAGIAMGAIYMTASKLTRMAGRHLRTRPLASCMIAGAIVAVTGYFLPLTMFSGEHEIGRLMDSWQNETVLILLLSALGKLFLVNICISLGWRGGHIFPLIFAGVAAGYAAAALTGIDGSVAVAVVTASMCAYTMRKPFTAAAVLLLCFPVTYIILILAAALVSSKVPVPESLLESH